MNSNLSRISQTVRHWGRGGYDSGGRLDPPKLPLRLVLGVRCPSWLTLEALGR